jgi:hypothetical protein
VETYPRGHAIGAAQDKIVGDPREFDMQAQNTVLCVLACS